MTVLLAVAAVACWIPGLRAARLRPLEVMASEKDEGRIVVNADTEGTRRSVSTLSGLAVADGLAAAFDLSPTN